MQMITVMGASGHTGQRIAQALLKAGEPVRAIGRDAAKLAPLQRAGAQLRIGNANDAAFLAEAFAGADAVYTLVAPSPDAADFRAAQDRMGEAIAQAVRESGVKRVVMLSSLGADLAAGTGPIAGLHAQEERLAGIAGLSLLRLRPAWFFENVESQVPLVEQQGMLAGSVDAELAMPMVGTADIAAAAVAALRSRDTGVRELLGPHDVTHNKVARLLGQALGRPDAHYVRLPDDEMVKVLVGHGVSESFARLFVEMTRAINAQRLQPRDGRSDANTTPTRFEDYARELQGSRSGASG